MNHKELCDYHHLIWKIKNGLDAGLVLFNIDEDGELEWCGTDKQWENYQDLIN